MVQQEPNFPHLAVDAATLKAQASLVGLRRPQGDSLEVVKRLQELLYEPSRHILERPSHKFRAQLVRVGWELARSRAGRLQLDEGDLAICAEAIEYLHLGSLIVDDIQDGSEVRREGPALHCVLGTPHALAVGNWLYFRALTVLDRLSIGSEAKLRLFRNFHRLVELAHYGQALDACVKVDQVENPNELAAICEACLNFKSGAIVALAMVMGACLADAHEDQLAGIEALGSALGAYLQRYNDVGNLLGAFDEEKKLEDMLGKKPSYVWAFVVQVYGAEGLSSLRHALAQLPDERLLSRWLEEHKFAERAKQHIECRFEEALTDFVNTNKMTPGDLTTLFKLKERIQKAYV